MHGMRKFSFKQLPLAHLRSTCLRLLRLNKNFCILEEKEDRSKKKDFASSLD